MPKPPRSAHADALRIADRIQKENYYLKIRVLDDGTIIALMELMYTRSIIIDVDQYGYSKRFCFKVRAHADSEFDRLQTGDDEPTGYIARRN